MRFIFMVVLLALSMFGCSNDQLIGENEHKEKVTFNQVNDTWQVSPTFKIKAMSGEGQKITNTIRGKQGRLGFTDNPFVAGKDNKYMWLFWGNADELVGKEIKIVATSKMGKQIDPIQSGTLGGENWGAPAHFPTFFSLPFKGLWKLDAYVADQLFGSIIVEVQ